MTYTESIIREIRCPRDRADEVEELMRCQYGTLDHLDRATFAREARICWAGVMHRDEHVARGPAACAEADEGIGYCPICGRDQTATMRPFRLLGQRKAVRR